MTIKNNLLFEYFNYILIVLSAFLLFAIQPVVGKILLPVFGGVSSVWLIISLFFQCFLFLGYFYSYVLTKYFGIRAQTAVHFVVTAVVLLFLILYADVFKILEAKQTLGPYTLFILLFRLVGLPYFLLSTTSTLVQRWYSEALPDKPLPYWLYALSNAGSLLAVFGYPLFIEPFLSSFQQFDIWKMVYLIYGSLLVLIVFVYFKNVTQVIQPKEDKVVRPTSVKEKVNWLFLSFLGVLSFLVVTNKITYDIISVPLFWMLPLGIYLLTYIISFSAKSKIQPYWYIIFIFFGLPISIYSLYTSSSLLYIFGLLIHLFFALLIVNTTLYNKRPASKDEIPIFYLIISLGGALAGIFVGIVVPLVFVGMWEFSIYLAIISAFILHSLIKSFSFQTQTFGFKLILLEMVILLIIWPFRRIYYDFVNTVYLGRNFFGTVRITDRDVADYKYRYLSHSNIIHGVSYAHPELGKYVAAYYTKDSGWDLAATLHPMRENTNLSFGVVGLGTGAASMYCRPGDTITYYEIDKDIIDIAKKYFDYYKNCGDGYKVVLGDARKEMELERENGMSKVYDVLLIDAFSGDSVPIHLLTKEAIDLYLDLLKDDGILLFHVSNIYLDLPAVLSSMPLSDDYAKLLVQSPIIFNPENYEEYKKLPKDKYLDMYTASWFFITKNTHFLDALNTASKNESAHFRILTPAKDTIRYWSDTYSNIVGVLKLRALFK